MRLGKLRPHSSAVRTEPTTGERSRCRRSAGRSSPQRRWPHRRQVRIGAAGRATERALAARRSGPARGSVRRSAPAGSRTAGCGRARVRSASASRTTGRPGAASGPTARPRRAPGRASVSPVTLTCGAAARTISRSALELVGPAGLDQRLGLDRPACPADEHRGALVVGPQEPAPPGHAGTAPAARRTGRRRRPTSRPARARCTGAKAAARVPTTMSTWPRDDRQERPVARRRPEVGGQHDVCGPGRAAR